MNAEMLPAEKIYFEMANDVPSQFWVTPSHEGVSKMKHILSALKPFAGDIFSGSVSSGHTVTTVASQMDYIESRILRWENELSRQKVAD